MEIVTYRLVVLGLGDPHLLEGGERGENGATDPNGVLCVKSARDLRTHHLGTRRQMKLKLNTHLLLSGGETILTFIEEGARAVISFCIRSAKTR